MEAFYRDVNEEEILLSSILETCYILSVHHQKQLFCAKLTFQKITGLILFGLYPAYNVWFELDDLQGCDIHNAYNETNKPDQFIRIRKF